MGKELQAKKQAPGPGDCDWDLVNFIMERKLSDAEAELSSLRREKLNILTELRAQGPMHGFTRTIRRAVKEAEKYKKGERT